MTVYCIIDPTGDVVPFTAADTAGASWERGIKEIADAITVGGGDMFRTYQAAMERDGYRLGRATGVTFERVG